MLEAVRWLKDAISSKKIVLEMTYYNVQGGQIQATDGRIIAGYPYDSKFEFLAPGKDLERLLARFDDDVKIEHDKENRQVLLKSGRSRGAINTLDIEQWNYPGVGEEDWQPIPAGLVSAIKKLSVFASENANHLWACGVTLYDGWVLATNNVAIAGMQVPAIGKMHAIIPLWAIDFIVDRTDGLSHWCHTENYLGFKWKNGAWMRSNLIDSQFPEKVAYMIKAASTELPDVDITDDFRKAVLRVADLAESSIKIDQYEISASFGNSTVTEEIETDMLGGMTTLWGAKFIVPVMKVAEVWDPFMWPKPAAFRGDGIVGYIVGMNH